MTGSEGEVLDRAEPRVKKGLKRINKSRPVKNNHAVAITDRDRAINNLRRGESRWTAIFQTLPSWS